MVEPNESQLSDREKEILRLVATGASNKEIAAQLVISPNTVKVHLRNIFAKIGVASRTEATLYAIQQGLAQVARPAMPAADDEADEIAPAGARDRSQPVVVSAPAARRGRWPLRLGLPLVAVVIGLAAWVGLGGPGSLAPPTSTPETAQARWEAKAPMPTARSGLAAVVYANQVYAIGGRGDNGTTGATERYDPVADQWVPLASKPTAVADIQAAVIGGRIYVPGGRLASGEVVDVFEVFDPREEKWETRNPLPQGLCAYALTAFEGKLYLFGGWDGERYSSAAFEYDPDRDEWRKIRALPGARGYAGAAVIGGQLFVVGGYDGQRALARADVFSPDQQDWARGLPLPAARYASGSASLADTLYLVGGQSAGVERPPAVSYSAQRGKWETIEAPMPGAWSEMAIVPLGNFLYAMGGLADGAPTDLHLAYQAIFTVSFPIVSP